MPNYHSVLNVKVVVAAFNQEKALVGAFSVITNLRMDLFEALVPIQSRDWSCLMENVAAGDLSPALLLVTTPHNNCAHFIRLEHQAMQLLGGLESGPI